MPTCFVIVVCVAIVVGSAVYIAVMNHQWWNKKPEDESDDRIK